MNRQIILPTAIATVLLASLIHVPIYAQDTTATFPAEIQQRINSRIQERMASREATQAERNARRISTINERLKAINDTTTARISRQLTNLNNRLTTLWKTMDEELPESDKKQEIKTKITAIQDDIVILQAQVASQREKVYSITETEEILPQLKTLQEQIRADVAVLISSAKSIHQRLIDLIPLFITEAS